jgi:predicted RNA-binding protein YlxR (DUF448 family)
VEKKIPFRTCIGCRKRAPKASLLRFACTAEGIEIDTRQRLEGRGVYLCRNRACVEKGLKAKSLAYALRIPASRQKMLTYEVLNGLKREVEKLVGEEAKIPKKEI